MLKKHLPWSALGLRTTSSENELDKNLRYITAQRMCKIRREMSTS